ncbi:hypothetical protein DL765_006547 [Monosporascus sp. GIB2]|nr:hypothetical protein DL765_006547 [Monosporascus sp. GIB2]
MPPEEQLRSVEDKFDLAHRKRLEMQYTAKDYKSGIYGRYVAHPSFVTDEELAAIPGPLPVAAAEFDNIFPVEDRYRARQMGGPCKEKI